MNVKTQAILDDEYLKEWAWLKGSFDALWQIIMDDFPRPVGMNGHNPKADAVTRYDLDMVRGVRVQLGAIVEGYERKS